MKNFIIALALSFIPVVAVAQPLPDNFAVVQQVYATNQFDISTASGQAAFTDAVVCALNQVDSRWGNLRKNPGQTNIHGHAEDSALFARVGAGASQSVDFIAGAGAPGARPGWNPDQPRYSETDWLPPHNCGNVGSIPAPSPNPGPTPAPVPPTTVVDLSAIVASLARLEAQLGVLQLQVASVGEGVTSAGARIETLLQSNDRIVKQLLSPPDYRGSVFGAGITLRPTVKPVTP